jgi:hypothetical protein
MMKHEIAQKLGEQLGKVISSNNRYPGYLWVRVEYPLNRPLMPQLSVKVKGRGVMLISTRTCHIFVLSVEGLDMQRLIARKSLLMNRVLGLVKNYMRPLQNGQETTMLSRWHLEARVIGPLFQVSGMPGDHRSGTSSGLQGGGLPGSGLNE